MNLILASRSPRRLELLRIFEIPFTVREADLDESRLAEESPAAMTKRLALAKAQTIFEQESKDPWVIGGDTTVAIANQALGKPQDQSAAIAMLNALSGNTHQVISAVALIGAGFSESAVSTTDVTFDRLTDQQIERYCSSPEPFDKAGGYGIQGFAGTFVKELRGSYSGVVGLPLFETRTLLEKAKLL